MTDLIVTIVSELVEDKDAVKVIKNEPNANGYTVYNLKVATDDVGRIIGKKGKIAKSIRTVLKSAATICGEKVALEID